MKLDQRGTEFIQGWEKCAKTVYLDQGGFPTGGYGHKSNGWPVGTVLSQQQCDQLFAEDVIAFESCVNNLAKVPLTQNQFNALVSFVFNVGAGNFKKSTLLRNLNSKDYASAGDCFLAWDNYHTSDGQAHLSQGLLNRRKAERELFLA